jgi:hypothetical protein
MHFLHAILVKIEQPAAENGRRSVEALHAHARQLAETALEPYEDKVWRSYARDGAGEWADHFPGVLLGAEDPDRFASLLDQFSSMPLQAALDRLRDVLYAQPTYRTPEEIAATPGCEEIPVTMFELSWGVAQESPEGKLMSGIRRPPPVIDNEFLEQTFADWDEQDHYSTASYDIYTALERAQGFYTIDSRFFSVPDNRSRVSAEVLRETQAHPERFALVFFDLDD